MSLLLSLLLPAPLRALPPCSHTGEQDLNCNGVVVSEEAPVDPTDPLCAANTDADGVPYPNADYYYDYGSYGCRLPVVSLDAD